MQGEPILLCISMHTFERNSKRSNLNSKHQSQNYSVRMKKITSLFQWKMWNIGIEHERQKKSIKTKYIRIKSATPLTKSITHFRQTQFVFFLSTKNVNIFVMLPKTYVQKYTLVLFEDTKVSLENNIVREISKNLIENPRPSRWCLGVFPSLASERLLRWSRHSRVEAERRSGRQRTRTVAKAATATAK